MFGHDTIKRMDFLYKKQKYLTMQKCQISIKFLNIQISQKINNIIYTYKKIKVFKPRVFFSEFKAAKLHNTNSQSLKYPVKYFPSSAVPDRILSFSNLPRAVARYWYWYSFAPLHQITSKVIKKQSRLYSI